MKFARIFLSALFILCSLGSGNVCAEGRGNIWSTKAQKTLEQIIDSQGNISNIGLVKGGIGTTSTDGLVLKNPTAATVGAQQISPRIRWTGQGWKTDATAGSQVVDWKAELVPVQGAANPQARLDFNYQINGAGFQATPTMSLLDGKVGIGTVTPAGILQVIRTANDSGVIFSIGNSATSVFDFSRSGTTGALSIQGSQAAPSNNIILVPTSGNVGIGMTTFGTSAAKVLAIGAGTAPTTSPADITQLWSADINAEAGKAGLMMRSEITANGNGAVVGAFIKTDTGDLAAGYEGMIQINTFDNTAKIWAEGAWRAIATAW